MSPGPAPDCTPTHSLRAQPWSGYCLQPCGGGGSRDDRGRNNLRTAPGLVCMHNGSWGWCGEWREGRDDLEAPGPGPGRDPPPSALWLPCIILKDFLDLESPVCRDRENPSVTYSPSPPSVCLSPPQGVSDSRTWVSRGTIVTFSSSDCCRPSLWLPLRLGFLCPGGS